MTSEEQREDSAVYYDCQPAPRKTRVQLTTAPAGDAADYVRAVFEGFAVRQKSLRGTRDTTAIRASTERLKTIHV